MSHNIPLKSNAKCPICRQAASAENAPFCSRGCKDRDLLQWLGEGYRLPGQPIRDGGDTNIDEG